MFEYQSDEILGEVFKLDVLMTLQYPPVRYIVEQLIPEEAIIILSAKPASFKTWLAYDIAISVSSGKKFLGEFNTKKTGTLIVDGEAGVRQLRDRFIKLNANSHTNAIFCQMTPGGTDCDEEYIEEMASYCNEHKIGLIIFDSLARFISVKDENSSMEVAKAFRKFSRLKSKGISVLFIAHSRKNSSFGGGGLESIRGSSDIGAACDVCINIERINNNTIIVRQSKNRFDEEIIPFKAQLRKEGKNKSVWHYLGESVDQDKKTKTKKCIQELLSKNDKLNQKTIGEKLEESGLAINPKTLRSTLNEMIEEGAIISKKGSRSEIIYSTQLER